MCSPNTFLRKVGALPGGLGFALVALAAHLVELLDSVPVPDRRWPSWWLWLFMPEGHVAKRYVQGVPAEPTKGKFPCAPGGPPKGCTWRNACRVALALHKHPVRPPP